MQFVILPLHYHWRFLAHCSETRLGLANSCHLSLSVISFPSLDVLIPVQTVNSLNHICFSYLKPSEIGPPILTLFFPIERVAELLTLTFEVS